MTPNPATVRSKARYARAVAIVRAVTLNEHYAAFLKGIMQRTKERQSDLIRRLIAEEAWRHEDRISSIPAEASDRPV